MNYKEYTLNEYQQKIIKERTLLNFNQELKKKNDSKKVFGKFLRKNLNILIHQFYKDGIQFYGFTIDLVFLDRKDPLLWFKVNQEVENWISDMGVNLELAEFCYISVELNKANNKKLHSKAEEKSSILDGLPHLHGVVGVRSILGDNDFLDISVKKLFRSYIDYGYIKIIRLKETKNIKKYWNYVIKENNFKFHRMTQYSHFSSYQEIYGTIKDLELIYDEGLGFGLDQWSESVTKNIAGVKNLKPTNKTLIIYLLNLFLMHLDCAVNKNKIYQKILNTKYSWKLVNNLKVLKDNNVLVFEYLKKIYPQQLEEINTMEIINKDWNKTMDDILVSQNRYLSSIEFNRNAIEFIDGVYFFDEKIFYDFESKFSEIKEKMQNNSCCTYYNKIYSNFCVDFVK